ncbi:unnamed protein product, partial [Rotaria socialis]
SSDQTHYDFFAWQYVKLVKLEYYLVISPLYGSLVIYCRAYYFQY